MLRLIPQLEARPSSSAHNSTKKVALRASLGWRKQNLWIFRMTTCIHVSISVSTQGKKCLKTFRKTYSLLLMLAKPLTLNSHFLHPFKTICRKVASNFSAYYNFCNCRFHDNWVVQGTTTTTEKAIARVVSFGTFHQHRWNRNWLQDHPDKKQSASTGNDRRCQLDASEKGAQQAPKRGFN